MNQNRELVKLMNKKHVTTAYIKNEKGEYYPTAGHKIDEPEEVILPWYVSAMMLMLIVGIIAFGYVAVKGF